MLKQEDNMITKTYEFKYIDRDESILLLGVLRNLDCEHCPDFFKGCAGNYTKQELVMMPIKKYLEQQKEGTERYMCGKLRNIFLLNESQIQDMQQEYNEEVNKQIGFLSKCDKIRVDTVDINERIRKLEEEANLKINQIVMQANKKIEEMQTLVNTLQNRLTVAELQLSHISINNLK